MAGVVTNHRFSQHACRRMDEMGLSRSEVRRALIESVTSYPGAARYGPGRRVYVGGDLAVVVEEATDTVITVLWHRRTARHGGDEV